MLRILDYPWHQVHSFRLMQALPAEFAYVIIQARGWNVAQRPIPDNWLGGIYPDDLPGAVDEFDMALLHLDQWCDHRLNTRGLPFRVMLELTRSIPQVCIIHGTPDSPENRERILRLLGDMPAVCNSRQAAVEWDGGDRRVDRYGLQQFRPIIHGYKVDDFWSAPPHRRRREVFTICSGGTVSRWYHGTPLLERLMRDVPIAWYGPLGNRDWLPNYVRYRRMLSESLIYFSPTRRAPMPGSRTEAMLSGCCVVSVPGNDWETYIDHGRTGYIVETYEEARDTLRMLLDDPNRAWRVGQAGRKMARDTFTSEFLHRQWAEVLEEIGL